MGQQNEVPFGQFAFSIGYIRRIARHVSTAITVLLCLIASLCALKNTAQAGQGYITAGFGGGPKALNSYQGIIYAPFGSLSETGLILRAWNKAFRFSYETSLQRTMNVPISALGLSIEAEVGWQYVHSKGRYGLYGGLVWRDHLLTPTDPNSTLTKSRIGFSATVEAQHTITEDFGISESVNYIQGINQYWAQIRPYMMIEGSWKTGLDIASTGGEDYNTLHLGLFASDYEFSLWTGSRMYLGGQAGMQYSIRNKKISPYAGLHVGYLF